MSSTDAATVRIARPLLPQHFSRTFPSLANRNFRLLLSGLLVSGTGGWIQRIAQDWLVLTLTDSPTAVGITTACQFVPTLVFGLHAGLLADRLPKRLILLITQTAVLEAAVSQLPPSMKRIVRGAQNYVIVRLAPVRDGLRWIDVPDPRTRRSDKLQSTAQSD